MEEYSSNIKKEPDDSYVWTCSIDPEYYRESLKPGLYACLGIAVFLLLFGGYLAYKFRNPMHFGIVVGCVAIYLLITALTFRLAFSADDPHETYKMSDIYTKYHTPVDDKIILDNIWKPHWTCCGRDWNSEPCTKCRHHGPLIKDLGRYDLRFRYPDVRYKLNFKNI